MTASMCKRGPRPFAVFCFRILQYPRREHDKHLQRTRLSFPGPTWLWGDRGGESHDDDGTNDARNAKEAQRGTGEDDESAGAPCTGTTNSLLNSFDVFWVQPFDPLGFRLHFEVETECGCLGSVHVFRRTCTVGDRLHCEYAPGGLVSSSVSWAIITRSLQQFA